MLENTLTDKVILVTGAAGALGDAVARRLAGLGAVVVGLDRQVRAGSAASFLPPTDLTDPAAVAAALAELVSRYGQLDGVCTIAGGFAWTTLADGGPAAYEQMFRINVLTAATVCQAAAPLMAPGGSIVTVGAAAAAERTAAGMGAYAAAKAGVARLTESLAAELKDRQIRVNAILPTILDTPANRADMPDADPSDWVAPDALADVIAFLLGEGARAVTAALIPVRGRVL
jgi:NAD(P)-dependent dehydrogenase (short-subunit alcohol dehydrogenase family)